jgi:predicted dehydrogenase
MRSSEVTARAGEVLARGLLGEIYTVKAWGVEPRPHYPEGVPDENPPEWLDWDRWLGPAPQRPFNRLRFHQWNNYRDYGNGEIGGDGIHDIDLARWALGVQTHPIRIVAHGSRVFLRGETEFPDNMVVVYEYADGRTLIYENRNFAPYKMHGFDNGNIFYGTKGYMIFSRRGYFQTFLGPSEKPGPGAKGSAGNQEHVHNFIDVVLGKARPTVEPEDLHLSCALVHLGEIAYRTRAALEFDPQREEIRRLPEANQLLTKTYRDPWALEAV